MKQPYRFMFFYLMPPLLLVSLILSGDYRWVSIIACIVFMTAMLIYGRDYNGNETVLGIKKKWWSGDKSSGGLD